MKALGGTFFGFLTGIITALLLTSYIDSVHSDRDKSIVNVTAQNMIKEIKELQTKRGTLSEQLKESDIETKEVMNLLLNQDGATKETIATIQWHIKNNGYKDAELLVEQKLKEGKRLYFYALILKNLKNSHNIYINLTDVEKDYVLKVGRYNRHKEAYSLALQNKNKVHFK